jgi:hypothetical protein
MRMIVRKRKLTNTWKFVQAEEDYEHIQSQTYSDDKKKKAAHNLEAGKRFQQQHVFVTAPQKRVL